MDNTKYQITKTVRFKLEPMDEVSAENVFKPLMNSDTNLSSFYNDLNGVLANVKTLLLKFNEGSPEYIDEEGFVFKKDIYIRYDFLMAYVKRDFFAARLRTKEKYYQVDKYPFLVKKITEVLLNLDDINSKISSFEKCGLEEQKRRAEIAYWINRLDNRFHFQFIYELIKSVDDKKFADSSLKNLLAKLDCLKEEIAGMKALYLPAQSNGSLVATASLNYYTVERTPKLLESVEESSGDGGYSLTTEYNKVNKRNQSKIFESIYLIGKSDNKLLLPKVVVKDNKEKKIGPNWSTVLENINKSISYLRGKNQAKVNQLINLKSIVSECERNNYPFINIKKYFKDKNLQINLKVADDTVNEVASFFIDFDNSDCLDDKYKPLFPDDFGKKLHKLFTTQKTYTIEELLIHFSLEEAYFFLKCWRKSIVKATFTQNVYKYLSDKTEEYEKDAIFESLKEFDLYRMSDDDLKLYIDQTKKIKEISNEINRCKQSGNFATEKLQNRLQEECDERNSILTKQPLYDSFCKFYKDVAMEYGKNKALKKSIEKENNTAVQLNYWSFISEVEGIHFVYFIPRNSDKNYKDAKKALMGENVQQNGVDTIYYFESLTLRALRKLCFNKINDNTFRNSLSYNLPPCEQTKRVKVDNKFKNVPTTDFDKIQIYVNVLKDGGSIKNQLCNYPKLKKEVLDVRYDRDTATVADFETRLNQFCYRKVVYLNRNADAILKDNSIPYFKFKIELPHKNNVRKNYTHLLSDFFSPDNENSDYPTRLNPEVKLFRRDGNPEFGAWYDCGKEGDERNETRFEKARYTLALTFTEHADAKKVDYSFATDTKGEQKLDAKVKNIQACINKFNKKFDNANCKFALGIDLGTNEGLAYLTTCDEGGNPILFDVLEINEDCKNGNTNLVKKNGNEAIYMQNPSYYLNKDLFVNSFAQPYSRDNYAHKAQVCSIDLTTAKVFSLDNQGNRSIVLDSDYSTHLNLKKINAQVSMSENRKNDPECEFIIQEDTDKPERIFVVTKELAKKYAETENYELIKQCQSIYDFNEKYDTLKSRREIFNEIQILERQLGNENLEENINKVKKNMVANMVGVIYHLYHQLQKRFGQDSYGLIVFEGLDEKTIASHRDSVKADITLTLRNALLKKFQNDLLVPPYKEISKLTDVEKFKDGKQYGIVQYVSESQTSRICPMCDEVAFEGKHTDDFVCQNCHIELVNKHWNWDNVDESKIVIDKCDENIQLFASLDCNDKIAAFNIARRGLDFI